MKLQNIIAHWKIKDLPMLFKTLYIVKPNSFDKTQISSRLVHLQVQANFNVINILYNIDKNEVTQKETYKLINADISFSSDSFSANPEITQYIKKATIGTLEKYV